MKKLLSVIIALMLATIMTTAAYADYAAGVYKVTVNGFGGPIVLSVEVDNEKIVGVTVIENSETVGYGSRAIEELPGKFVAANSADIDGVAGATISSTAMKEGVAQALMAAMGVEPITAVLSMADGTYTGTARGYKGDITICVTVADNKITAIDVAEQQETGVIGGEALNILADRVLEAQSLAIDSVSGATVTSAAFFAAMTDALNQAGENAANALKSVKLEMPAAQKVDISCDIVVIGGGMAGFCAAIEAADLGANVLILEKLDVLGGSTSRSEGYVIGAGTEFQKENGVEDTVEHFYSDIYSVYKDEPLLNADMLKKVCYESANLIPFLQENGVEFEKLTANTTFEPRATRRNHCTLNKGSGLMAFLSESAAKKGIDVMMGTAATQILLEDGKAVGVKATNKNGDDITVTAKATILCAGSYGGNVEMVKRLNGNIRAEMIKGCGDGDAYNMAEAAGAQMINLDYPQLQYYFYWNGIPKLPVYPASAIAPVSNILLVDGVGARVANEANFNFEFVKKVYESGQQEGYCIVGQKFYEQYPEVCEAGLNKTFPTRGDEIAFKADTVEELAAWAGLDAEKLRATVDRYNELCEIGEDQDFHKDAQYMEKIEGPYFILKLPAIITDGYSGIKINENAQVINIAGEVIPGFYAAGCCAVPEMSCVNYYGCGTSIATCGVYGRAAADHAVANFVK